MSNDLALNVANYLSSQNDDISNIPQRVGFLPYLSIAYGTSNAVLEGKATPGDFVFEGKTSLGKAIEVIVADYRLHMSVYDNDNNCTVSDCFAARNEGNVVVKPSNWETFAVQAIPEGQKMNDGIDLLLWIPQVNSFAVYFLKGTTYDSFAPIYNSGRGGRLVQVTSRPIKTKKGKTIFVIDAAALNRAIEGSPLQIPGVDIACDVTIPLEFMKASRTKFRSPVNTEVSEENVQHDR